MAGDELSRENRVYLHLFGVWAVRRGSGRGVWGAAVVAVCQDEVGGGSILAGRKQLDLPARNGVRHLGYVFATADGPGGELHDHQCADERGIVGVRGDTVEASGP